MLSRIVHIQPEAPPKPVLGRPCNGCGLCCLYEPCPLGCLLSRRRRGACMALRWDAAGARYRCGALTASSEVALAALPSRLHRLAPALAAWLRRLAPHWIAAGQGCDCSLEVQTGEPPRQSDRQSPS